MRGRKIVGFVFLAHGLILGMLWVDDWMNQMKKSPKKIVVHTIESSASQPMAISPRVVKKEAKKMVTKKSIETSSSDALLKTIEKNLDLLGKSDKVQKTEITIPKALSPKSLNKLESHRALAESSPMEQVIAHLQESLELPEFGSVKIQLTINASGSLQEAVILETKSQKNGEFLKNRLPQLRFPCLNQDTTLTIVFSNAL